MLTLHRQIRAALLVTLVLSRNTLGDVLTLKDGTVIQGEAMSETPDGVLFKGKIAGIWGEVFFEQNRIDTLRREPGDQSVEVKKPKPNPGKADSPPSGATKPRSPKSMPAGDEGEGAVESAPAADTSIGEVVAKSESLRTRVEPELVAIFDGWPMNVLECKLTDPIRAIAPDKDGQGEDISIAIKLDIYVDPTKWGKWAESAIDRLDRLGLPSGQAEWSAKSFPRVREGDHADLDQPDGLMDRYLPSVSAAVQKEPLYLMRGELIRTKPKPFISRVMFPLDTPMLKSAIAMWGKGVTAVDEVAGNRTALMIQRTSTSDVRMYLLPPNVDLGLRVATRMASASVTHMVGVRLTAEDAEGEAVDLGKATGVRFASLQERSAKIVWPVPAWDDELFSPVMRGRAALFGAKLPDVKARWLLCFPNFVVEFGEGGLGLAASRATSYSVTLDLPKREASRIKRIVPHLESVELEARKAR